MDVGFTHSIIYIICGFKLSKTELQDEIRVKKYGKCMQIVEKNSIVLRIQQDFDAFFWSIGSYIGS